MRFAYIDSQGNEVSIPSVDALALRIELGAIGPDTELYDAQADRWGPAQTHEIFHTLSRTLGEANGFVAPPPPVVPPPAEPPPHLRDEFMPAPGPALEAVAPPPPPPPREPEGPAFDFILAPPPSGEAPLDFSLPAEPPPAKKVEKKKEDEAPVSFDFGSGLELAPEPFSAPEPSELPPAMDFSPGSAVGGSGMDFEQPISPLALDGPPAWLREEEAPPRAEPSPEDGALDLARPRAPEERAVPPRRRAAAPAERDAVSARGERPAPQTRPSPPKRTRSRPLAPLILGVVGVAVMGAGGFLGWRAFQARRAAAHPDLVTPSLPPVVIPAIPAELLPRMRDLGELALGDMIAELGRIPARLGIPAEPNPDWLAGVYLANASGYPDVQAFWEGIEDFVDQVRDADTRVFHERYQARLAEALVPADTAALLLERADSGFLAARADRFEAYALMDDLVNAALDLHDFLLANEARIEYAPAAGGVSKDPVLEAVPATEQLRDEMWNRVGRITAALDAMGTLDKVTTARLTAVLFDRIRRAGFR